MKQSDDEDRPILRGDLIFAVVFVAMGVIDLLSGRIAYGVGFLVLGIAVLLTSSLAHGWLKVKGSGTFTWLRIVAYVLAAIAVVIFVGEITGWF